MPGPELTLTCINKLFYKAHTENTDVVFAQFFYCKIIAALLFWVLIRYPMQLMMYIGNDLIESIPLDTESISQPGYLGKFKRMLKQKYADLIRESSTNPDFLVINLSTETNNSSKKDFDAM